MKTLGPLADRAWDALGRVNNQLAFFVTGADRVAQNSSIAVQTINAWTATERTAIEANRAAIEDAAGRLATEWLAISTLAILIESAPDRRAAAQELVGRQVAHVRILMQQAGGGGHVFAAGVAIVASERSADLAKRALELAGLVSLDERATGTKNSRPDRRHDRRERGDEGAGQRSFRSGRRRREPG